MMKGATRGQSQSAHSHCVWPRQDKFCRLRTDASTRVARLGPAWRQGRARALKGACLNGLRAWARLPAGPGRVGGVRTARQLAHDAAPIWWGPNYARRRAIECHLAAGQADSGAMQCNGAQGGRAWIVDARGINVSRWSPGERPLCIWCHLKHRLPGPLERKKCLNAPAPSGSVSGKN